MPGGRGIVIPITADGDVAKKALEMVREQMERTQQSAEGGSSAFNRFGSAVGHSVSPMQAASAGLRALEGNFTNNIRAGERFLSMLPGAAELLTKAFPVIGIAVLGTALVGMGEKAYEAIQNIVELKGALESLGQVDLTVAKHLQSNADAIERSVEETLNATQGHVASLKQRLAYESGKPIDLSELFYDKNFSGLKDSIKTNYESLYKSVAPQDVPERLRRIRSEVTSLQSALDTVKSGEMGPFVPKVGGYGPSMAEDPQKYYEARIKAASDVEKLLSSEAAKRQAALTATQADIDKPKKERNPRAERSDNGFLVAETGLADAQAKYAADQTKSFGEQRLAELEKGHKLELVSDQEFYQEKLKIQIEGLDAEENALKAKQSQLQQLYNKQAGDKTLHRDKDGNSVEQLRTQKEMIDNQKQIGDLEVKKEQYTSENTTERVLAAQNAQMSNLRAAAELEKARGQGIEHQVELMRAELDLEVKRMQMQGASPQAVTDTRDLEKRQEQMLQLDQIQRQIRQTESEYTLQAQQLQDKATKSGANKMQTEHQLNALYEQEANALKVLVAQYDALAASLKDPALTEQAAKLHAELAKLETPDQRQEAQFGKTLATGITSMADTIAEQTLKGKTSFHEMAKEIEADALKLAMKLLEQKFLMPGLQGASSGSAGHAAGTAIGGMFGGQGRVSRDAPGGGSPFERGLNKILSMAFGLGVPKTSTPSQAGAYMPDSGLNSSPDFTPFVSDDSGMDDMMGAAGLPAFAEGGMPTGPSIIGEKGPEIWTPPSKGGTITPSATLQKLADGGASAKTTNITTNVVNQSSQPVTAEASHDSSGSGMIDDHIIHVILRDAAQGGPVSQAFGNK